ncbi:MAG: EAL domain-containing protein [Formivibrio sp.]|nr:EAL domain-containing protein [Formivibrio sp.]
MLADPVLLRREDLPLGQSLLLHQRYFDAFEAVVATLMEPDAADALSEALAILVAACNCSVGAIFLDEAGHVAARLACYRWHPQSGAGKIPPALFHCIRYIDLPGLANMLEVGMVINSPLQNLAPLAQNKLAPFGVQRLICLPLLERGEAFGFVTLLDIDRTPQRSSTELHFLAMLSNVFAQGLLKQRAEAEMHSNQQRLRALVGATQDMVFEMDHSGKIVQVWSGHPALPPAELLVGKQLTDVLPFAMAAELVQALPAVLEESRNIQVNCVVRGNAEPVYLLVRLSPVQAAEQVHAVAMVHDVTSIMQDTARRKTTLDTLNLLEEAVIDLSPVGELIETTLAWARLRGIDPHRISADMGQPLLTWVLEDDRELLAEAFCRLQDTDESITQRFRLLRHEAEPIWIEARLIAHYSPDGVVEGLRGVLRDVTEAHLAERHITQLALYDGLTRLPNRLLLDDELHQAIERAQLSGSQVALGFIDLDHFKEVNDAFGHKTGDEMLVSVAKRLSGVLQGTGMLARWGGDEFIAVIPDLTDLNALRELAESLCSAVQQSIMLEGQETSPTVSVGFSVYPQDADSADELLSAADHAMYHAKTMGRNNVCFYADIMHFKVFGRENMAIQSRLSGAIHDDILQVFYQPIVDVNNGAVLALEALARWKDGAGGWVSPELFIPMAEKTGLIQGLSERIMEQSFAQLARWRAAGLQQKLMLNISRNQLYSPCFVSRVVALLARFDLSPQDVVLEITESVALTDSARQIKHLHQIVVAGFQVAIDDFGTGYSSLSQLHDMPVQFIKIDASFSQRVHTENGRGVMQAIVKLGQTLNLEVVVEGVEQLETAEYLRGIGVTRMQGFYFSEPVPPDVAERMLRLGVLPATSSQIH